MRNIVISIYNGLLSEMITASLMESGAFMPLRSSFNKKGSVVESSKSVSADILLLEVAYNADTTLDVRMKEIEEVKKSLPECKIVLLCDENSAPELARKVMQAKKDGVIDNFFYSSVGAKYLLAALNAL